MLPVDAERALPTRLTWRPTDWTRPIVLSAPPLAHGAGETEGVAGAPATIAASDCSVAEAHGLGATPVGAAGSTAMVVANNTAGKLICL